MDNVSELPNADKFEAVLAAYKTYRDAVNNDEISRAEASARLPDAQVFCHPDTLAVIVILAERHDSADADVQAGAAAVAKQVMALPKVKIAVEEPITYNGTLLSNVGWAGDVSRKPQSQSLFEFEATAQGSISHQIYARQVGGMIVATTRYAAERMPRDPQRYNNPEINRTMVANLIANTSRAGDISVFPVGPDHLSRTYDRATLTDQLMAAGWDLLTND